MIGNSALKLHRKCVSILPARSNAGTGHLKRHQKSCRQKIDQAARFSLGLLTILMILCITRTINLIFLDLTELCRLIASLDLPLGIGEIEAWEDYIVRAHNPRFVKVSRQTTTRDLSKLFTERHNMLKNSMLSAASSLALTSDIWSSNAKEDYISVVAHFVSADWELQKKVIRLRLIEVKHTGEKYC